MRSGLANLVAGVKAHFAAFNVTATVAVGVRALPRQDNQGPGRANRVVIVPFDPKSGDAGQLDEPEMAGDRDFEDDDGTRTGTARALADWRRSMVVSVWALDSNDPEDELAQEAALEDLLEETLRAIHHTGFANVERGKIQRVIPVTRAFGAEARFALMFTHPIYDHPNEVGYPVAEVTKG